MPSVMTLEGPRLAALPEPTNKRLVLFVIGSAALLGVAWLFVRHDRRRGLRGLTGITKAKDRIRLANGDVMTLAEAIERKRVVLERVESPGYDTRNERPTVRVQFLARDVESGESWDINKTLFESKSGLPLTVKKPLRGPEMLKIIASESRTPEEFARRIEAWNSAERDPLPVAKLAKAYRKASPAKVAQLIRDAREAREEGRERLWTRMSKGLRGDESLNERQRDALTYAADRKGLVSAGVGAKWGATRDIATLRALAKRGYLEFVAKDKRGGGYAYDLYQYRITDAGRAAIDRGLKGSVAYGRRGLRGLAGYRVVYGSNDGKKTFGVLDENTFETIEGAIKRRRLYKNRGMTAWIEDEQGNFVPVPGAKSPTVRKSFPR